MDVNLIDITLTKPDKSQFGSIRYANETVRLSIPQDMTPDELLHLSDELYQAAKIIRGND